MTDKVCSRCGVLKPISEYYKADDSHFRTFCKSCYKATRQNEFRKRYAHNYYLRNKESILARCKEYRDSHKEQIRSYLKEYDRTHKHKRFYKRTEARTKYEQTHRQYYTEYMRDWRKRNPLSGKESRLRSLYGMTLQDYQNMRELQSGMCAICGMTSNNLCIDHDHALGQVRQLLCPRCNRALGLANDDVSTLEKALAYLVNSERI